MFGSHGPKPIWGTVIKDGRPKMLSVDKSLETSSLETRPRRKSMEKLDKSRGL